MLKAVTDVSVYVKEAEMHVKKVILVSNNTISGKAPAAGKEQCEDESNRSL